MRLSFLLVLLIVSSFNSVFSQANLQFQPALITKKDSIEIICLIEKQLTYDPRVYYKMPTGNKLLSIKSSQVKHIKTQSEYIENITLGNKERLMTLVERGDVNLFIHYESIKNEKIKQYGALFIGSSPTKTYAIMKNNSYYEINKDNYKSKLTELLSSKTLDIKNKVESVSFFEIQTLVREYNIQMESEKAETITAKVIDSESGKPISNVTIYVPGINIEALTNILGFFQIKLNKSATIVLDHPDYEISKLQIPEATTFTIKLTRKK